jgi:N6-L-threonylcarbamoyladenine synthase
MTSTQAFTVLGIETSCDETAAAVVRLRGDHAETLSDVVYSQWERHAPYRGVVPEIAARAHVERIDDVVQAAMSEAGVTYRDLDGVAATAGPGLVGGVMVGLMAGKAVALAHGKPFIAVNHLEGHALSPRLTEPVAFPYLLLLISGGHGQFVLVEDLGRYRRLGSTIDDAAGEAFDKTAKLLDLGFPGGPAVERAALTGDPKRFDLPRPLLGRPDCDLSFAGLKSAVRRIAELHAPLKAQTVADLCAGFQQAVGDVLVDRGRRAMRASGLDGGRFVVAGGVAANAELRGRLMLLCAEEGFSFHAPPLRFCTDNGAMIALAGAERLRAGLSSTLDAPARARWPLDETAALLRPVHRAGRKGAKA